MGVEIERRFLVCASGWRPWVTWEAQLRQGYLRADPDGFTVRVRLSRQQQDQAAASTQDQAWLTLKAAPTAPSGDPGAHAALASAAGSIPQALTRWEFEYAIPPADGEQLLALASCRLEKRRYGLALSGGDWVVDVFEAENAPLVVAEVELEQADAPLSLPSWCGAELTGWHQLSNASLAHRPFAHWPEAERQALLAGRLDGLPAHS